MMFKWMCAIIVVVMSTYVFTACGDDSDDPTNPNAPSPSSIVGTWEVVSSPVTQNGPTKGTLFYMASNGVMKMQLGGTGEVNTGRYSYIPATGLLTPSFEGVRTGTAVLSMRSDGKISMQVSESDNNYTLILEKVVKVEAVTQEMYKLERLLVLGYFFMMKETLTTAKVLQ